MRVQSLINEVRYQLSDLRGLGYPDALLLEFINDGLCLIYQLRPEDYAGSRVIAAVPGSVQCLNDCCDRLISVDATVDACGNPVDILRQGSIKLAAAFDKAPINGHARTFTLRDNVPDEFVVHPPVRADEEIYWRVTCTTPPDAVHGMDDSVPDCANHEALVRYVLYRAWSTESESATSQQSAQVQYQHMMQLLGLGRKTDAEVLEDNAASA